MEVVATFLLLCVGDLTISSKEEGARLLLGQLFELEANSASTVEPEAHERMQRLRGLATLALVNLDRTTKVLLLDHIVDGICHARLLNLETRVALMAALVTNDAPFHEAERRFIDVVDERKDQLRNADITDPRLKNLEWNYLQITSTELGLDKQFSDAVRFFGQRSNHGSMRDALAYADEAIRRGTAESGRVDLSLRSDAGWLLVRSCLQVAYAIVSGGRDSISERSTATAGVGRLFQAICALEPEYAEQLLDLGARMTADDALMEKARALLTDIASRMHNSMVRVGPSDGKQSSVNEMKGKLHRIAERTSFGYSKSFNIDAVLGDFERSAYLLIPHELEDFLTALFEDVHIYAPRTPYQAPAGEFGTSTKLARLWGRMRLSKVNENPVIEFWNQGNKDANIVAFEQRGEGALPLLTSLGGKVHTQSRKRANVMWFVTIIMIPVIRSGQW